MGGQLREDNLLKRHPRLGRKLHRSRNEHPAALHWTSIWYVAKKPSSVSVSPGQTVIRTHRAVMKTSALRDPSNLAAYSLATEGARCVAAASPFRQTPEGSRVGSEFWGPCSKIPTRRWRRNKAIQFVVSHIVTADARG